MYRIEPNQPGEIPGLTSERCGFAPYAAEIGIAVVAMVGIGALAYTQQPETTLNRGVRQITSDPLGSMRTETDNTSLFTIVALGSLSAYFIWHYK